MKTLSILICYLFTTGIALAQSSVFLADKVTGNLYRNSTDTEVEGSRMLSEEWAPGIIYMQDGYKADKFMLKFDFYRNELLFLHEGKALVVMNPVKEFIMVPVIGPKLLFRRGYQPVERNDETTYYQVLQDGPCSLLKHTTKTINERKEYNKAGTVKEYATTINYYVFRDNGDMVKIKKDKSSLVSAIGDNDGKLMAWVDKNKLRCKTEEDMMAVVKGYNENLHK